MARTRPEDRPGPSRGGPIGGAGVITDRSMALPAAETSVVICAFSLERLRTLREAVASIGRQTVEVAQTIVVIDHNPDLLDQARSEFTDCEVIENSGKRGLSGARNSGVEIARGEVIAFLDDDAVAEEDWLAELSAAYADPRVIGTGGVAVPRWQGGEAPAWLPREFYWTVGCSYLGLPEQVAPIRNPIGATMSFRREVFGHVGGFRDGIGRLGKTPLGCEETELSIRARAAFPQGLILHLPGARVRHLVPRERTTWRYFASRCRAEGRSKAMVGASVGTVEGLSSEWTYTTKTLPGGVLLGLREARRGDLDGLRRAGAIIAGLVLTAAGYLHARIEAG